MIDTSRFFLKFKTRQYEKTENFQDIPISQMPDKFKAYSPNAIESGAVGFYWKSEISGQDGKYYQPVFDIESEKHADIGANIDAALSVRYWLSEKGLLPGLRIILSGAGFRFVWPFLIPGIHGQPLRSMIRSLPEIDNSSAVNFHRFFAYRGNSAQGRGKKNIHTHLLPNTAWLDSLTEAEYRELTAGKPKYADYCEWIHAILPTAFIPEAWDKVLSDFRADERLRNSFISIPQISSYKKAFDMQICRAELDRRGISFKEMQAGGIDFIRPAECLFCGRKDTHPYISTAGYAKCFSVNCDAGQRGNSGQIEGIPPRQWISGYDEIPDDDETMPEPAEKTEFSTLAQCREAMVAGIMQAMETGRSLLISSDPGAGKTTTAIDSLSRYAGEKTIVFGFPTKKKVMEAMTETRAKFHNSQINISMIVGRTEGSKKLDYEDGNCIQAEKCRMIGEKGFKPGMIICPECNAMKDGSCLYKYQFTALEKPGLVFTTHAQVTNRKMPPGAVLIFDEDPLNYFIKEHSATLGEISAFAARYRGFAEDPETISGIMQKIQGAAEKMLDSLKDEKGLKYGILYHKKPENITLPETDAETGKRAFPLTIWQAAGISEQERDSLERWISFFCPHEGERPFAWQKRLYYGRLSGSTIVCDRGEFNIRMLQWFRVLIGDIPGVALVEIHPKEKQEPFRFSAQFRDMPDVNAQIIALDGTGEKHTYDALFQRDFAEISAHLPFPDCRFIHIRRALGKGKAAKMKPADMKKIFEIAKADLRQSDSKILIGTHKKIEDSAKEAAAEIFAGRTVESIHFLGNRGLNEYKDFSVFIAFGTLTINPLAAWKKAQILFPGCEAEQARYIRHISDAENLQTLHRVRPVLSGGKTIIICGRAWIPGLPRPEKIHDLRKGKADQADAAYERIKAFYQAAGFITKDLAWFLGVGNREDQDMVSRCSRQLPDIMRLHKGKKGVFSLIYRSLYSKTPLFPGFTVSKPMPAIIFPDKKYWGMLISRLRADIPGAGLFRQCQNHSGQWSNGVGSVSRVRAFAEASGGIANFQADKWEQTEESTDQYPSEAVLKELEN